MDEMLVNVANLTSCPEREKYVLLQFPCADLSGEMFYELYWEAVGRLETCGLKVRSL